MIHGQQLDILLPSYKPPPKDCFLRLDCMQLQYRGIIQDSLLIANANVATYMIVDYLPDIVTLSASIELSKVIHKRSHAGRQVQHTIHQLTKRDFS